MVSTLNLDEKYNRVRKNFCFYLDIQDHGLARSLSRRIQDMGLQQEVFLTCRVSHVVRERGWGGGASAHPAACARREARRAGAMVESARRLRTPPPSHTTPHNNNHTYVTLTVQKAISLLDKLYDTFFAASRKTHVNLFTKHFIKIEFLDKPCRPVFKEFDEWPTINIDPDPPKDKRKKTESPEDPTNNNLTRKNTTGQKMTRKSRPRIKEKEEKEAKGGYCEMCNTEYADAGLHRRSPHHLAFVRDHNNFLALDSLIGSGNDVATFLDKAAPLNGERRSQRRHNGDLEPPAKRQRTEPVEPARNGARRKNNDDRSYYKVVGVSTKLRSSGGFAKKKESPPPNGAKPLVVKFRKVRRSELSVLSDEAEQFMFPKRASSTGSTTTSDEEEEDHDDDGEDEEKPPSPKRRSPQRPAPSTERRRLARPLALKEESSEEDSWPEDKRRRKRRAPAARGRGRRAAPLARRSPAQKRDSPPPPSEPPPAPEPEVPAPAVPPEAAATPTTPPPDERQRCMKWEDGRLKYTPAVEQLEFAFESVPRSEPWYETFQRQDRDCVLTRNVPQYFSLYSTKAPKLPYEIGQLPPLKPNCCPLSDLVKREKPGPSRSYGTRGMKKQKLRKRTAAVLALEGHPRKSPREHASTLAILGSAGLLNRRKLADDNKSTASEDTVSDTHSNAKVESGPSEAQEASERLQQFLSEVFQEADELDVSEEALEGEPAVTTSTAPDLSSLVSECDRCDMIRNELEESANRPRVRRGKVKKKNRTGWPNKRRPAKKDSRANSPDAEGKADSLDRSSAERVEDESTRDAPSEEEGPASETEQEHTVCEQTRSEEEAADTGDADSSDNKLLIDLKVVLDEDKRQRGGVRARRGRRPLPLASWLPVVRVARVDPHAHRTLRSAARAHR